MDKFSRITVLFLLFCAVVILQFQPAAFDEGGQNNDSQKPLLSKILRDTVSVLRKSHKSSWEKIKTVIHDLQMQFAPPNLDFKGVGETGPEQDAGGVKGTVKEAVGKSFDKSKEAVEESAKLAAEMAGEAIHMTTEKVKKESDSHKESEAEL